MADATLNPPESGPSAATSLAFKRMEEALNDQGRRRRYPSGTVFIPADLPGFGEALQRHMKDRLPVVVIYPDGKERMVIPGEPARAGRYLWRTFRYRALGYARERLSR